MSLDDEYVDSNNDNNELISQLAELGIKPHGFTEKQQDEKYRQWQAELNQGRRRRRKEKKKA